MIRTVLVFILFITCITELKAMPTYQDQYGRFHDKPTKNGEPSSNNGWIYTAYANKLGITLDRTALMKSFRQCQQRDGETGQRFLTRSPYDDTPPISRDEILGMVELGLLKPKHLNGWSFSPRPIPRFNLFKLAAQLWEVKGKHRNYFWENNLDQLYRFAFSVPLTDRHFILQKWGKYNQLIGEHLIYKLIAKIDSLSSKKSGIRWLKYEKDLAGMQSEFPEDHPFRNL